MRVALASVLSLACVAARCDAPSATLDAGDLLGVFDEAGAPSGSARPARAPKASAAASALPAPSASVRSAPRAACAAIDGRDAPPEPRRTVGRPRCRDAEILESKDPEGAPRYACVHGARALGGKPAPVVVVFHDQDGDAADVEDRTSLRKHLARAEVAAGRPGLLALSVQGRALGKAGTTYDLRGLGTDNMDLWAVDHFFEVIRARGLVDPQRVYALGVGWGAKMAAFVAFARPTRFAAFAGYGAEPPTLRWTCNDTPPPGLLFYRACDAVAPCDKVELGLDALARQGVEVERRRLGAGDAAELACATRAKCSKPVGEAHHARFPKGREKELLAFFAKHALAEPAPAEAPP